MWPSAPSTRKFGTVACPSGDKCDFPNCIFSHDALSVQSEAVEASGDTATADASLKTEQSPQPKRLKLDNESPQIPNEVEDTAESHVFEGFLANKNTQSSETSSIRTTPTASAVSENTSGTTLRPATRPISPPSLKTAQRATLEKEVQVNLMPRKLQHDPVSFTKRLSMLKVLHQYMEPLNDKLKRAVKPEIQALCLSANLLNKLAVDEEEKIAKEHTQVYENVLKQRIFAYKKMTIEEWVKMRREVVAKETGILPKKNTPKKIITGLSPEDEVTFLTQLIATEQELVAHGVLTKLPTKEELWETKSALQLADFWETCERCKTRFQVFPDRRQSDGALTTKGSCQHHWGKKMYPKPEPGQPKEPPKMTCCNEPIGSPGCTTSQTHAFKISDHNRLSLIMAFIETPENDKVDPHAAVCFDCEMAYTTYGLELLRLTVISWPNHKPLIDVLVRPMGHILDFNTRFSGVTPEMFHNAKPYDPENPKPIRHDLRIVESPEAARDLMLSHVSPRTPILGHAIENDLNTVRLVHPTVVDTAILFPTRQGLPYRHGLKALAKMHLDLDIQQGGAAGHDSYEDAKTTGELVRAKVAKEWKRLQALRFEIRDGGVYPPLPDGPPPPYPPPNAPTAPAMMRQGYLVEGGKRKREEEQN
ncbi:hypothetical protein DM02DRAFT_554981 [Periconia macrospinosa]|uniref:Exonuclease domain-containing protein n=1 Tax=Periconia macrospinosa TaxID=97972 RepID=A0A2V1E3Z6_9PLEO|nr:hypothetical protein DM02DRAFT_554981 [Periconia macrospinosa]